MKLFAVAWAFLAAVLPLTSSHVLPPSLRELGDFGAQLQDRLINSTKAGPADKRWDYPRPANDEIWSRYYYRGCTLTSMMKATDSEAGAMFNPPLASAASRFNNFLQDQPAWGWKAKEMVNYCSMGVLEYGLENALNGLGASSAADHWRCWEVSHGDREHPTWNIDQQWYWDPYQRQRRVTGASFEAAINYKDGIFVARSSYSPAIQAKKREPPVPDDELPEMKRASDIQWGMWSVEADTDARNLKWIIRWSVVNDETGPVISRAYGREVIRPWPGKWFQAESTEGKALIGSPISTNVAWFLLQHKAVLGNKVVGRIGIFMHDSQLLNEPCIIFEVANAPPQQPQQPQ